MAKLVFVLLDGCNAGTAQSCMGYMTALTVAGQAQASSYACELPALSRPLYHCILTGLSPAQSGIVHNTLWQPHPAPTLFHTAHQAGLVTAAAAYYWISELCNTTPYVPVRDRLTANPALPLSYGLFYTNDAYPDDHVFLDAEALRLRHNPDVLLVHSMGIDYAGHQQGADSAAYRNAVREADMLLAHYVPLWRNAGYAVIITSDHGMSSDGLHNGASTAEQQVPLWLVNGPQQAILPTKQTEWYAWCCQYLQIDNTKN